MRKFFLLLIIFSVALGGCGDIEWFPEQGVSQFSFDAAADVAPGETVTSNAITVQTPNASETITVSGGGIQHKRRRLHHCRGHRKKTGTR